MQTEYLNALKQRADADERVLALWVEGSLGKNAGDKWSDVDVHLLVREADLPDFGQSAQNWLQTVRPLVLFRALFDGKMLNSLTDDGLRVDVWLHGNNESVRLHPAQANLVWERSPNAVQWDDVSVSATPPANAAAMVERHIGEFWRCVAILPSVLGRGEKIVAVLGFFAELAPLTEMLILGTGAARDTGVKHLNRFLPPGAQAEVEAALNLHGLTVESLAHAHLALAAVMQKRGPQIAAQFGVAYPAALEEAALRYVRQELSQILAGVTQETIPVAP